MHGRDVKCKQNFGWKSWREVKTWKTQAEIGR